LQIRNRWDQRHGRVQVTWITEVQILADRWRWEYYTFRPNTALQGRTPLETAQPGAAASLRPPTLISTGLIKGVTSRLESPTLATRYALLWG